MTGADIRLRLSGGPTPGPCSCYAFLSEDEKTIYQSIREAMLMCKERAPIPFTCTPESLQRVLYAVTRDEPMLYYIDVNSYRSARSIMGSWVQWDLRFTEDEITRMDSRICAELSRIRIPAGDIYRRELYLHNALIGRRMQYDSVDPGDWQNHCVIGPLLQRHAVCEGFAKLFLLLCRRERIPAMCVHGDSTSTSGPQGSHLWNIVQLGGQFVHVDLTWDINLSRETEYRFDYLNLSDSQAAEDHQWNRSTAPACNTDRYSAFHQCHCDLNTRNEWINYLKSVDGDRANRFFARVHFSITAQQIGEDLSAHVTQRLMRAISYTRNEDQNVVYVTMR